VKSLTRKGAAGREPTAATASTRDATASPSPTPARAGPAATWNRLRRIEVNFPPIIVVIVAIGLVIAGQLAEDLSDSAPIQMLPPEFSSRRWTLIAAVLYMLVIARVVDRTVQRSLPSLERVLHMDPRSFRAYVHRLRPLDPRTNAILVAASALIVLGLFVGIGLDLPVTNDPVTNQPIFLPGNAIAAVLILAGYSVVGWAGLGLIYLTTRLGRALGELCREPIEVDVFDTTNLLPFGNIALAGALAPAGIIVIFLLGLGMPATWLSWSVLVLAAIASLAALLLPLRGVHRQMSDAKDAVLANLNARIRHVYEAVDQHHVEPTEVPVLNARANTLIPLRKTVQETTTWPFADTVAFGRAILIASAPLIYTVLSELIKVFWITPLSS
jgi:hypothetical protein